MADTSPIETFTGADGFGGSGSGAALTPTSTGAGSSIGDSLTKIFSNSGVQASIGNVAGAAFGAVENLFGVQTPAQQAAAAAAAAEKAKQDQQMLLIVGGGIAAVVITIVVIVMVRKG